MTAIVSGGPGQKSWTEVPDPSIQQPTDAIIEMETTTICGTDLHVLKGDVPPSSQDGSWAMKGAAGSSRRERQRPR